MKKLIKILKSFLGNLYLKSYSRLHPIAIVDVEEGCYSIGEKKYPTVIMDCDGYVTRHDDGTFSAKVAVGWAPRTVFESTITGGYDLSETSLKRIEQSLAIIMLLSATVSNRTKILVILRNAPELQILKELLSRGTYKNIKPKSVGVFPGTLSLGYNFFGTFIHSPNDPK